MSVTVYGASDDLIEVEGDIREEFPWYPADGDAFLGFSNGVVLRVALGDVWRITPVAGADLVQVVQCPENDEDNYSDRATVDGRVLWVVCGAVWSGGVVMSRPDCYFEAPDYYEPVDGDTAVFLAGGITGCERWHDVAAQRLMTADVPIVVLNPNRESFPIHDPNAGWEQVQWEQHHLHLPNVITMMWFPACDPTITTQPIAQFELGQALGERRQLLVGADPGYPRERDVRLMLRYNRSGMRVFSDLDALLDATIAAVRGDSDE